jgi:hypothetical protein
VPAWANTAQVTWNDNGGSLAISLEDSFVFTFNNCWVDDPTNDIDAVLNGQMAFLHYSPHVQANPTYTNLRFDETNAGGVIADSDITLNGGLALFIPGI